MMVMRACVQSICTKFSSVQLSPAELQPDGTSHNLSHMWSSLGPWQLGYSHKCGLDSNLRCFLWYGMLHISAPIYQPLGIVFRISRHFQITDRTTLTKASLIIWKANGVVGSNMYHLVNTFCVYERALGDTLIYMIGSKCTRVIRIIKIPDNQPSPSWIINGLAFLGARDPHL